MLLYSSSLNFSKVSIWNEFNNLFFLKALKLTGSDHFKDEILQYL
jgi:hypothetical protein